MSTPIELEKMRNTLVGERMDYERRLTEKDEQIEAMGFEIDRLEEEHERALLWLDALAGITPRGARGVGE